MTESGGRLAAPVARYPPPPTGTSYRTGQVVRYAGSGAATAYQRGAGVRGAAGAPRSAARSRRPAWGPRWCGPGRGTCRSTRCGSGRGRRWFGTAIPLQNLLLVDGDAEEVTVNEPTTSPE